MAVTRHLFILLFVALGIYVDVRAIDDVRERHGKLVRNAVENHPTDAHDPTAAISARVLRWPSKKGTPFSVPCRTRTPATHSSPWKADNVRALVSLYSPIRLREADWLLLSQFVESGRVLLQSDVADRPDDSGATCPPRGAN